MELAVWNQSTGNYLGIFYVESLDAYAGAIQGLYANADFQAGSCVKRFDCRGAVFQPNGLREENCSYLFKRNGPPFGAAICRFGSAEMGRRSSACKTKYCLKGHFGAKR